MLTSIQKYLIYGLAALLLATAFTGGYYYLRCGHLENELDKARQERADFETAAKTNAETIDQLKSERNKMSARLENEQATCNQRIAGMQHYETIPEVKSNGTETSSHSGNPLLDALNNELFPVQTDDSRKIRSGADSATGSGAPVLTGNLYCTDAVGARNLLKNVRVLMHGWGQKCFDDQKSMATGTY